MCVRNSHTETPLSVTPPNNTLVPSIHLFPLVHIPPQHSHTYAPPPPPESCHCMLLHPLLVDECAVSAATVNQEGSTIRTPGVVV